MIKNIILTILTTLSTLNLGNFNNDHIEQRKQIKRANETTQSLQIWNTYKQAKNYIKSETINDITYTYSQKETGQNNNEYINIKQTVYTSWDLKALKGSNAKFIIDTDNTIENNYYSVNVMQIDTYSLTKETNIELYYYTVGMNLDEETQIETQSKIAYEIDDKYFNIDITTHQNAAKEIWQDINKTYNLVENEIVTTTITKSQTTGITKTNVKLFPKTTMYVLLKTTNIVKPINFTSQEQTTLAFIPLRNTSTKINYKISADIVNYDVIDIPGLIFTIITIPFAFFSQAFNLTMFPHTPYQLNIGNLIITMISIMIFLYLIKKIVGVFL